MKHLSLVLALMALGSGPAFAAAIDHNVLLEAADKGASSGASAKAFDGTVEWSRGSDDNGVPTLIAKVAIPDRELSLELLLRKNDDPTLPASHLFEITFNPAETFAGGAIAQLPGILAKDEELKQGKALVGAGARVVGNEFLFALSGQPEDADSNVRALGNDHYIDLAIVYATGKRAIITLEKDDAAQQLFRDVIAEWSGSRPPAATSGGPAAPPT